MHKCKTMKNKNKSRYRRNKSGTRRRHRGGCNSCSNTGSSASTAPVWTSSGGANPEIYKYTTDPVFYSSS
jgi:hypothetical protein